MKTYELPLSRDYVRHWGLREAVRELVQNAIDSESPFEYAFEGDTLSITSRFNTLAASTLILGATSKAGDNGKIGSFGEGYKIALLVMAREGIDMLVRNGDVVWRAEFGASETYGAEVLRIVEEQAGEPFQGLEFVISGLGHQQANDIRDTCLLMQPPMTDVVGTKFGSILPSRPGKLYVGGLLVCDTGLTFGYDANPEHLRLERDRQTVNGFDLKWLAKEMWFDTRQFDKVAELLEANTPDLEYAEHGCPELVKEACYRQFVKQHPGAVAVKSQDEMERMVAKGMTKTVYVGGSYHSAVTGASSYKESFGPMIRAKSPQELLEEWMEQNQRNMRLPLRIEFKKLIASASSWRVQ